jgi:hypothetical protein
MPGRMSALVGHDGSILMDCTWEMNPGGIVPSRDKGMIVIDLRIAAMPLSYMQNWEA